MTGPAVLLILVLATALVVALNRWAATTQALIDERADHAATRYDLGATRSAYDAVRAVHEEADLGVVELRMPTAVEEWSREAAIARHPAGRALRAVGGGS